MKNTLWSMVTKMTITKRNIILLTSTVLLFGFLGSLLFLNNLFFINPNLNNNPNSNENPNMVKPAYNLTLYIDYGNGTVEKHFNLNLTDVLNITVFDLLLKVAVVNYSWYGDAVFVDAINGVFNNENNSNRWWQYWVNGELPMIAANQYYLENDSLVEWKYWYSQVENQTISTSNI